MNKINEDCRLVLIETLTSTYQPALKLKSLVTLSEVSPTWYLAVQKYCEKVYSTSLFERGVQMFTDKLIETAFILKPLPEFDKEIRAIKNTVKSAMHENVNQLTLSTIKSALNFAVTNVRFVYSPFFITMLNNLLNHEDVEIEKYILTDLRPRLLKNGKALNPTARVSLESLQNKPKKSHFELLLIALLFIILSIIYKFL